MPSGLSENQSFTKKDFERIKAMSETQCKCATRKGISGGKLLVIVTAMVLTAGVICVYAGNGGANRGPAWYAEKVTPVSGQFAAENAADSMPDAAKYAKGMSRAFRYAAKKVMSSVVFITNSPAVARTSGNSKSLDDDSDEMPFKGTPFGNLFNDPNLRPFLKGFPQMPQMPHQAVMSVGSGVIVDPSGIVLTNNHVVAGGGQITVRLPDGREFKATDIKTDPTSDLAILRLEGKGPFSAARLGESNDVEVGDWVLALGQPFGLEDTVTAGIISAKGRGLGNHGDYIQTDAAINPGNSGGPLVNLDGEVIGINTAIKSNTGAYQGVGFAIPIDTAKWVGGQLEQFGTVHRAYLGVGIQEIDQSLAEKFNVPVNGGVLVTMVQPDSPAAKAGVRADDVVLQFAGKSVSSPRELQSIVETAKIGSFVPLSILRDGQKMTLEVKCREMPENFAEGGGSPARPEAKESSPVEQLGIQVEDLTPEIAKQLNVNDDHGVVITEVRPGSPAELKGLSTGMVIAEVNRHPVKTTADLQKALGDKPLQKGVLLLVRSGEGSRFVVIRVE
jgi:serine protease Do